MKKSNATTLFLAGDVMTGRGIDQALPHHVDPVLFEPYVKNARTYLEMAERHSGDLPAEISYDYIWGDALEQLEQATPVVRIINLETAVTTSSSHSPEKDIHYRMHPQNISVLTRANIDVCILANNHVLDWGRPGLAETLIVLKEAGIKIAGAGIDQRSAAAPAIIKTSMGRLLIFGYAAPDAGVPAGWRAETGRAGISLLKNFGVDETQEVITHIESFREQGDRVIFSIHWGSNWGNHIPRSHRRFAHKLIDADVADIIYGHSSHHPKGIEMYKGRLILYGCGDLINDYEGIGGHETFHPDLSLLYFPQLSMPGRLISLKVAPMRIHRFSLQRADRADIQAIHGHLNKTCKKFNTSVDLLNNNLLQLEWQNKGRRG